MDHYLQLIPNDSLPISVDESKQRLLDADLTIEIHPSVLDLDEEEEVRVGYQNSLFALTGTIDVSEDSKVPCGVSAWARMSWVNSADTAHDGIGYPVEVASRVNARLLISSNQAVTSDNIQEAVEESPGGRRTILGHLGS